MVKSKKTERVQIAEVAQGSWKTCLNCDYWDESNSRCAKYNQLPPPKIILHGCPEHQDELNF